MELIELSKSISRKTNFIHVAIIIILALTSICIYYIDFNVWYKAIVLMICASIAIIYIVKIFIPIDHSIPDFEEDPIYSIALLNEELEVIREWDVYNKIGLTIGRNTKEEAVDIDLSDCTYASLVDTQHAVLNFAVGKWHIEDLYSTNGISIQKIEDSTTYKLSQDRPCQIARGDKLIIGKTQLLVR